MDIPFSDFSDFSFGGFPVYQISGFGDLASGQLKRVCEGPPEDATGASQSFLHRCPSPWPDGPSAYPEKKLQRERERGRELVAAPLRRHLLHSFSKTTGGQESGKQSLVFCSLQAICVGHVMAVKLFARSPNTL